ncbi:MAG: NUDIX domain-containing protein [Pseudonocardiaceae bacterium]
MTHRPVTPHEGETAILAADVVLFAEVDGQQRVLLIDRGWPPFDGRWALPGGHLDVGEEFPDAARRELLEETGIDIDVEDLVHVGAYGGPRRDPRGRVVTFAYTAALSSAPAPVAGDDARFACWIPLVDVLDRPEILAFDHDRILTDALSTRQGRAGGAR